MEALTKKKRIRAGHKASATKTVRHVEEILTSDTPDMERLSLLRLTLKEKFETIKGLDSEVIDLTEGEESTVAEEIEQADHYKETILACLVKVDKLFEAAVTPTASPARSSFKPATLPSARVKLPKLQLKPFSGELSKWTSFWESFESAIHNNN